MVWISVLIFVQQLFAINYFRCQDTNQCVKAYGGCGRYLSVHQRYKELYEAKAQKTDRSSFCVAPTEEEKQLKFEGQPQCHKDHCRLIIPDSKKS